LIDLLWASATTATESQDGGSDENDGDEKKQAGESSGGDVAGWEWLELAAA